MNRRQIRMRVELDVEVIGDGCIGLRWRADAAVERTTLMIMRSGAVPAYTSLQLSGDLETYQIEHLSRHQRYRVAVLATGQSGTAISCWWSVTPRAGLQPRVDEEMQGVESHISEVTRLTVMPQDARLTAYWQRGVGFVDKLVVEVLRDGTPWKQLEVEPEVSSLVLDKSRGVSLINGRVYSVRIGTRFAGGLHGTTEKITCTPAGQGEERQANRTHCQEDLIYASLSLASEIRVFPEDEENDAPIEAAGPAVVCCHCRRAVEWRSYRLVCSGCGAEFIPNGRGAFLEINRLRFGTCNCCLPRKILVQRSGETSLACAHSGKEHIRLPNTDGFSLIEDLPFGLCQCCRPRRPLFRKRGGVCCSRSGEKHRNQSGCWVLVPSQPVFDAAAIDDLLDAGLADICSTGVSRGSA